MLFLLDHYFPNQLIPKKIPSKNTRTAIRQQIIRLMQYDNSKDKIENDLYPLALETCRISLKPRAILDKLLKHIQQNNWVMPAYSTLQDMIGKAIKAEQMRLQTLVQASLSQAIKEGLNQLLTTQQSYYEITLVKKDQKNFNYAEVKKIVEYQNNYNYLYQFAQKLIPTLQITSNMIRYYASLIHHYPVAQLRALPINLSYLYLFCYLYHRMQKLNDNLMSAFIYYVDKLAWFTFQSF